MDQTIEKPDKKKDRLMAAVAYVMFFVPLMTEAKDDSFVKFHVKQGFALFLSAVIVWLFANVVPLFGPALAPILNLVLLVIMAIGIINAIKGVEKQLPLVGSFADYLKI